MNDTDFRPCAACGHDFSMHDPMYNDEGRDPCFFCTCPDFKDVAPGTVTVRLQVEDKQ
jgi:hypothetical protein